MVRPVNIQKTRHLSTNLPEDLLARLDLTLYSEIEQRVPLGSYKAFFTARMQEFFSWRKLDLEYLGFPNGYFISGPAEMIDMVEARLTYDPAVNDDRLNS